MKNPIVKIGNATLTTKGENEYTLDLKKGETVTITTQTDAIFAISPVDGEGQNFFGLQ